MEKLQRVAKLLFLLSFLFLLLLIPFISASLKSSYLYFILNLLIIVLGVEAMSSKPNQVVAISQPSIYNDSVGIVKYDIFQKTVVAPLKVGKKIIEVVEKVQKLKRCASRPSIFFIGSCDVEEEKEESVKEKEKVVVVKELAEAGEIISKQELFLKAEMFIGNFYKQLKLQRDHQVLLEEEYSWSL